MEQKAIQIFQKNSDNLPSLSTPEAIVRVRDDRENYPRYMDVPKQVRLEWLSLEILKYMRLLNMKPADVMIHAVALDDMICEDRDLCMLTQPEIDLAFKNGVFGKYGEYYGLTAVSLFQFIERFTGSEIAKDAALIIGKRRDAELKRRKEEERAKEQAAIRAEIEKAKADGTFVPTRGYDGLNLQTVDNLLDGSKHRHAVLQQARKIKEGKINI